MQIYDMHTHLGYAPLTSNIIEKMEQAGIYGGCVFSRPPEGFRENGGMDFEARLTEVLEVTAAYPDRLFPVIWVHPDEEDILHKAETAARRGVDAFKMICNNFFVYEEKSIALLKKIAELGKPVFFHTGILWDGKVSSAYNRPVNWEALIGIKGLKFSMGHCSWPWHDECIAIYGKFMNALACEDTAEMFFDITPGTPEIYREDLLTKLFSIGYDVGPNLLFGTDCMADDYNSAWAAKWLETDRRIMDKLGVSQTVREDMYCNNLMRFLGKSQRPVIHLSPATDGANAWSPLAEDVPGMIEKWYQKLEFPQSYDTEFYQALKEIPVSDAIDIESYDKDSEDGRRNLLSCLYLCEKLEKRYEAKGISTEILYDTLKDIPRWTDTWSNIKNRLYLGELDWLSRHLGMRLFKLGRLQFCFGNMEEDVPAAGLKKGDRILEVHIPAGEPLTREACEESLRMAEAFFAKHFPEYEYQYYTCHSWLLDTSLREILKPDSNILKFQEMFDIVLEEPSDAILRYVFRWDTTRGKLGDFHPAGGLASGVKSRIVSGGGFRESLGILKK